MTDREQAFPGGARDERLHFEAGRLPESVRLTLPATSANLGPGFDALGLALSLYLTVDARSAPAFSIAADGRDADLTGTLEANLLIATYADVLTASDRPVRPLAIQITNDIPLGVGCGSSAAALCAGVLLANHFGELGWTPDRMLHEAALREGHPDNVAACLYGGLTASKTVFEQEQKDTSGRTVALTVGSGLPWRLLLALPRGRLATAKARQMLPELYSRADAVQNVQGTAMLVAAFALDRPDLLRIATVDRLHQPYRLAACPLLSALLTLSGQEGVHSITLSGAGPAVLLIVDAGFAADRVFGVGPDLVREVLELSIGTGASVEGLR